MFYVLVCFSLPSKENTVKANQNKVNCCLGKGLRSVHRPFPNLTVDGGRLHCPSVFHTSLL